LNIDAGGKRLGPDKEKRKKKKVPNSEDNRKKKSQKHKREVILNHGESDIWGPIAGGESWLRT